MHLCVRETPQLVAALIEMKAGLDAVTSKVQALTAKVATLFEFRFVNLLNDTVIECNNRKALTPINKRFNKWIECVVNSEFSHSKILRSTKLNYPL